MSLHHFFRRARNTVTARVSKTHLFALSAFVIDSTASCPFRDLMKFRATRTEIEKFQSSRYITSNISQAHCSVNIQHPCLAIGVIATQKRITDYVSHSTIFFQEK